MSSVLELLLREDCELCEHARVVLLEAGLDAREIHIEDSIELELDYGLRIPVLRLAAPADRNDTQNPARELDWPFGVEQVRAWLET